MYKPDPKGVPVALRDLTTPRPYITVGRGGQVGMQAPGQAWWKIPRTMTGVNTTHEVGSHISLVKKYGEEIHRG